MERRINIFKPKVIIFGLGKIFEIFMKIYDTTKIDIIALMDNDNELIGKKVYGYQVIEPNRISDYDSDFIFITSSYYLQIKSQLIELEGIEEKKIIDFSILGRLKFEINQEILPFLNKNSYFLFKSDGYYKEQYRLIIENQEKNMFLNAKNLIEINNNKKIKSFEEVEFKVFSQFGEDGIIQWIIHNTKIENKVFVEFGVENYTESNTRFLLMNNNWTGLIIDGCKSNIEYVKSSEYYWRYDLTAIAAFVTKDNINDLIQQSGISGDIGLLSIDIDGNDYWILDCINCIQPRILICEYNSVFGSDKKVSVPYDPKFIRSKKHYSNLYFGASIAAFCNWAYQHNYYYIGSNSAGNNAFFVRKDCFDKNKVPECYNNFKESKFRESRDENGKLNYIKGNLRLKEIKEMELVDFETGLIDTIENLYSL